MKIKFKPTKTLFKYENAEIDLSPQELAEQMSEDELELFLREKGLVIMYGSNVVTKPDTCTCASNQGNGTICTNCGKPLPKKEECKVFNQLDIKTMESIDWFKIHHNHKLTWTEFTCNCNKCGEIYMFKEPKPQVPSEFTATYREVYSKLDIIDKINEIIKFLREGR